MSKYVLEMNYGCNINIEVESENLNSAITKAKKLISKDVTILDTNQIHVSDLIFEEVTYLEKLLHCKFNKNKSCNENNYNLCEEYGVCPYGC